MHLYKDANKRNEYIGFSKEEPPQEPPQELANELPNEPPKEPLKELPREPVQETPQGTPTGILQGLSQKAFEFLKRSGLEWMYNQLFRSQEKKTTV